jgi:hypothetical protein
VIEDTGHVVVLARWRRAPGTIVPEAPHDPWPEFADMTDDSTGNGADGLGRHRDGGGDPPRLRPVLDDAVTMEEKRMTALEYEHSAVDMLGEIPADVMRRVAHAHRRARRLLEEATLLVREQVELESVVGGRVVADDDLFYEVREATGLVALDSVLGNAAAIISAAGGGLWCGGAPRPWPSTAWQLPDDDNGAAS